MYEPKINDAVSFMKGDEQKAGTVISLIDGGVFVRDEHSGEVFLLENSEVTPLQIIFFTKAQMKKLVKFETTITKLTEKYGDSASFRPEETLTLTLRDVISALKKIKETEPDNKTILEEWYNPLCNMIFNIHDAVVYEKTPRSVETLPGLCVRGDMLDMIFESDILTKIDSDGHSILLVLDGLIERAEQHLANEKLPLMKRKFSKVEMERYVDYMTEGDHLKKCSKKALELYKKIVSQLCENGSEAGLRAKAYGCYGGDRAFPCDWKEALEGLLILYGMTGRPEYANSLGYIYYYGRCSNGKPNYEKAFRYFSAGAAGGFFESRYKIADMFANGYCVPKNEETAYTIVNELYNNTFELIAEEKFNCNFADVALRLGGYFENGTGCSENGYLAYLLYMQASFAIKKRSKYDYIGDDTVAHKIKSALDHLKEGNSLPGSKKSVEIDIDTFFLPYLKKYRRLYAQFVQKESGDYTMYITLEKLPNEKRPPRILVTSVTTDFCDMLDRVELEIKDADIDIYYSDRDGFIFDDYSDGYFFCGGKTAAQIKGKFIFTPPKDYDSDKVCTVASVVFDSSDKTYDYILDAEDVGVGDRVIVETARGEAEVTVTAVSEKTAGELALPLYKYKHITKKA